MGDKKEKEEETTLHKSVSFAVSRNGEILFFFFTFLLKK